MDYFIQTFGCQQNHADSERIAGILEALGMSESDRLHETDLCIVNTCSVRQTAEDRVYGLAHKIEALKKKNSRAKVLITGCMVGSVTGDRQRYEKEDLARRIPWADAFLDQSEINILPEALISWNMISSRDARLPDEFEPKRKTTREAYVNISTGCDNFCTFCVVPFARGEEESRTEEEILKDVRSAVRKDYHEITLLGQNVNSWGLDREVKFKVRAGSEDNLPFADLLRKVHEVEGVGKIRFLSSNPFDFSVDLIDALRLPKIDRYLHMAVQSGDNEVLARMNRRHTIEEFYRLVEMIRDRVSGIKIGTDLIVGFPGETEAQFENTVKMCNEIGFYKAYISKYSPRPGTAAARAFPDNVPLDEKKRRFRILDDLINTDHG